METILLNFGFISILNKKNTFKNSNYIAVIRGDVVTITKYATIQIRPIESWEFNKSNLESGLNNFDITPGFLL